LSHLCSLSHRLSWVHDITFSRTFSRFISIVSARQLSLSLSLSLFLCFFPLAPPLVSVSVGFFVCLPKGRGRSFSYKHTLTRTHTHTHTHTHTYAQPPIHSYTSMHVHIHTRTHTHTHTHNSLLFLTFLSSISRPSPASASQEPTTYEGDNYVLDTLGLSYLLGTFSDIALQKSRFSGLNVHVAHRVVQTVATDFVGNYLCEWAGLKPDRELLKASGNDEEFKVRTRVFGSPCVCLCLLDVRALSIS
jgi:hypothetical protein